MQRSLNYGLTAHCHLKYDKPKHTIIDWGRITAIFQEELNYRST